ncbi:MAG TPA: TonB-dependent receptor [Vicinamibacteria bacterium]|nr:TonB-dependent receptor [Vicinamibacteria bacterium]
MPAGDRRHLHPGHRPLNARIVPPLLAGALACAGRLPAEDEPAEGPPRLQDRVTVTASRVDARVADTSASVAVLPRVALDATAAPAVDDALRQVAGFSLFRRTGSRAANPTAQGVSLRGLGASGASRAIVLADGLPLNDPFGSWVYWARVPRLAIERIEVLRGGASDLYGSGALGGVVQLVTRPPSSERGLRAEASAGSETTLDASLSARGRRGDWSGRLSAEAYRTDGYAPVDEWHRGLVDTEAASRHVAFDATVERRALGDGRVFARGMAYGEDRENGTPLQENDTRIGLAAVGLDWGSPDRGRGEARLWGETQLFHQSFSAVAADRSSEDLTRSQRVPADAFGLAFQWSRRLGSRHRALGGLEAQQVEGETEETAFARGAATTAVDAGGTTRTGAFFVQDLFQAHRRLLASASARVDGWSHRGGRSETTPLATGTTTLTAFPDRSETAVSPRLGVLFRASSSVSLTASGYGAFRGPTLNELYRSFRVGDTLTLASPALEAERLWGGEAGSLVRRGPASLRLTAYTSDVRDAVANVTVATAPGLVTRQRRNVGRVRSRGLEVEAEVLFGSRAAVTAGYALTDARVRSFPDDPALEGRRLPQVPRHQATLQARYESRWRLGLQARWASAAFEDDRNQLSLDPALQVDLSAGRIVGAGVELFAAAENVLDAEVVVARTPVPSLGAPRTLRAGVRLRLF